MLPSTIHELVYDSTGVVDSTRTSNLGSGTCYWVSRTLPASGKSCLDSTIDNNNCEVIQFHFAGHGAGNYVTNFQYYVADRNAVALDMTHMYRKSSTFTSPSSYADADIYNKVGDWTEVPTSVPASPNISTHTSYTETSDPTRTQYIYNAVVVEASKSTGTGTWNMVLLYQYT